VSESRTVGLPTCLFLGLIELSLYKVELCQVDYLMRIFDLDLLRLMFNLLSRRNGHSTPFGFCDSQNGLNRAGES
jgi:hypothetical protein